MACDEVACLQANSKDSQRCPEVHSSTKLQHACISTRIKRAEGVKKNDEKSGLNPGPVREGEPAKGSSTYSAAARKFARRYARDACQEMPGPIETEPMVPCGIGQMMASPQVTGPLPSGDTAAPRVNETFSFLCVGSNSRQQQEYEKSTTTPMHRHLLSMQMNEGLCTAKPDFKNVTSAQLRRFLLPRLAAAAPLQR